MAVDEKVTGYQLRVKLSGTDVWRELIIPAHITFLELHATIQYAMGWEFEHLYEFAIPKAHILVVDQFTYEQETSDTFPFGGREEEKLVLETEKVDEYLQANPKLIYTYDMGDNWEHEVKVKKQLTDYTKLYPDLLAGEGDCPPEDSGGVPGYYQVLDAMADPKNPEYADLIAWLDETGYLEDHEFNLKETKANFRNLKFKSLS